MIASLLFALVISSPPEAVLAQDPMPASEAPAIVAAELASSCSAPPLVAQGAIPVEKFNQVAAAAEAYMACMSDFIEVRQAEARRLMAAFNAEAEASNTAITEANTFVERFNVWQEQAVAQANAQQ